MINNELVRIFKEKNSILKQYHNGDDCLIFPNIPDSKKLASRSTFRISSDEEYLLMRDTSFWSDCNQGLIMTDVGITCIPDNDDPNTIAYCPWECVTHVKYQDLCLYFYDGTDEPYRFNMYYFIKTSDEKVQAYVGRKLASLFSDMASLVETKQQKADAVVKEVDSLLDNNKVDKAIKLIKRQIEENVEEYMSYWHYRLSYILYFEKEDDKGALDVCSKGLNYCEEGSVISVNLCNLRRIIERKYALEDSEEALLHTVNVRNDDFYVAVNATDANNFDDVILKDVAAEDFREIDKLFGLSFLHLPYKQRKVLLPVDRYTCINQKNICVIHVDNLPDDLDFPIGHPLVNHLYIGHPLVANKYIPIEKYQLELVEDKVREFCQIAQCLGATEISIECLSNSSGNTFSQNSHTVSGRYESLNEISAHGGITLSNRLIEELSRSINLHQKFSPRNAPYLPEGMIWYKNEPSWQRLYQQRIKGGLCTHEERIETRKSQVIENREMLEIKGELETLFSSMNLEFTKNEEEIFEQQENAVLSIKIEFAPLTDLSPNGRTSDCIQNNLNMSIQEKQYEEEVLAFLEDGLIEVRERRALERLRERLGLTKEQAMKIEMKLLSTMTDEEKEYLDEYKAILEDGEISSRERKMLERYRVRLGISSERAVEIESMYIQ